MTHVRSGAAASYTHPRSIATNLIVEGLRKGLGSRAERKLGYGDCAWNEYGSESCDHDVRCERFVSAGVRRVRTCA
jgi:hypothetical protein